MATIDGDKLRGHLEMLILATLERSEAHGLNPGLRTAILLGDRVLVQPMRPTAKIFSSLF